MAQTLPDSVLETLPQSMIAMGFDAPGGPEVLEWSDIELPAPKRIEVRIRHTAVGVNFIDVYDRTGLYPMALPSLLGREAAGVVEAAGAGVKSLAIGDRVAYTSTTPGSYAEARNMPADRVVRLPDAITDDQAWLAAARPILTGKVLADGYGLHRLGLGAPDDADDRDLA